MTVFLSNMRASRDIAGKIPHLGALKLVFNCLFDVFSAPPFFGLSPPAPPFCSLLFAFLLSLAQPASIYSSAAPAIPQSPQILFNLSETDRADTDSTSFTPRHHPLTLLHPPSIPFSISCAVFKFCSSAAPTRCSSK